MKQKFRSAVNIFAVAVLCASISACGGNADKTADAQSEVTDSAEQNIANHSAVTDSIEPVDWNSVEEAARVSEPKETPKEDLSKQKAKNRITVLDFSATWCGPCRGFAPIFHEVAKEYGDMATFRTVDIDQNRDMADKYNIQAVPTIIILDSNGKELSRVEGAMSKSDFVGLIKEFK